MSTPISQAMLTKGYSNIPKIKASQNEAAVREKTDQFEAIIIKMMLDNAMKDDDKGLFGSKDPGTKIYKSMYRDELSKASAGGFGFSQMLFEHLTEQKSKFK
ncbi:MAG: rod-binding protein [Campylobacterota bacterium]|nr:rod-binding protein [Campylobacterota bacterium]